MRAAAWKWCGVHHWQTNVDRLGRGAAVRATALVSKFTDAIRTSTVQITTPTHRARMTGHRLAGSASGPPRSASRRMRHRIVDTPANRPRGPRRPRPRAGARAACARWRRIHRLLPRTCIPCVRAGRVLASLGSGLWFRPPVEGTSRRAAAGMSRLRVSVRLAPPTQPATPTASATPTTYGKCKWDCGLTVRRTGGRATPGPRYTYRPHTDCVLSRSHGVTAPMIVNAPSHSFAAHAHAHTYRHEPARERRPARASLTAAARQRS